MSAEAQLIAPRRSGVLLINLGTPDAPRTSDVRRYLRQFLSDPRVITMNPVGRWLLLNLIILPFRPRKSAEAYEKIWTEAGSPLLLYGEQLRDLVSAELGDGYVVALGMRYGKPSIASAVDELVSAGVDRIIALPLFPQYSSAANGSAVQELLDTIGSHWITPPVEVRDAFCVHPGFIKAFADVHREALADFDYDLLLFSFHGLPVDHVQRSERGPVECDRKGPCPPLAANNRDCYRAQCYATARALGAALELDDERWQVVFQSRLGRTPWIEPYLEGSLQELHARGVRRLAISSPAFVADCLETLEELAIRTREQWLALGGEAFTMVPSLNAHPEWVRAVAEMVRG